MEHSQIIQLLRTKSIFILSAYRDHQSRSMNSKSNDAMVNASASQAKGPRFGFRREHSFFSLKSPDSVHVAS